MQIVGRVLEVGMHKLHELGFPLDKVVDGFGSAPLPPPAPDFLNGMGRTNDAILYGGKVHLFVDVPDDEVSVPQDDLTFSITFQRWPRCFCPRIKYIILANQKIARLSKFCYFKGKP